MTYSVYANKTRHDQTRLSRSPIVLLERAWRNVARAVTEFLFFAGAVTVWESLVQQLVGDVYVQAVWHPQKVMTVIIRVAITTLRCAVTSNVVCPPPYTHTHSCTYTPDMRTGSSSLTVFMELTNICLCSWCVSSCCLSSIILDILVMPEEKRENGENLQRCKKLEVKNKLT